MRMISLKAYVLVSQDEPCVEVFRRPEGAGYWERETAIAGQTIELLGRTINIDEIYRCPVRGRRRGTVAPREPRSRAIPAGGPRPARCMYQTICFARDALAS